MKKVLTGTADVTKNLQKYLQQELGLTKKQISQAKFRPGGILVNGVQRRVNSEVSPGEVIQVLLEEELVESGQLLPMDHQLEILYEDEDVLAVNKPAGVVVHPSHGHYQDSLANMVAHYYQKKTEHVKIRPIGRLDKETSGIVLFAKNQTAAARLAKQKEDGTFQKTYIALVQGCPAMRTATIRTPICKDESSLIKMKTSEQGMHAVTHYEVLHDFGAYSLIRLHLETGRTHQIRVHMESIGHALLGDQLYGMNELSDTRAMLHAGECRFSQPFTGETICVKAELPEDMRERTEGWHYR